MKLNKGLIQGFDEMTPEQKIEALLGLEIDPTKEGFKSQADFDKVMKEAADRKRELAEFKKTHGGEADELSKRIEELENSNKQLMRERTIASSEAQFIAMGYDKELAHEAAEASADGDMTKMFAAQQKFIEAHDKKLQEEALKKMTPPHKGSGGNDDDGNEAIGLAKFLGKESVETAKSSQDILSQYTIN